MPLLISIYRHLSSLLKGGVRVFAHHRLKKGKEDPVRFYERFGAPSQPRPAGTVVWFHGASVGEAMTLLPLLHRIRGEFPHITPLVTTGTVTAATMMAKMLPQGCIHQYSPYDVAPWVESFLNHWRPTMGVFVESEFWPNLITKANAHKIPLFLINAILSEKSYRAWRYFPKTIHHLLSCFQICLAQSEKIAHRLISLGAPKVVVGGNLKFSAAPLPHDSDQLADLRMSTQGRPLWVAASTHKGEERVVGEVHQIVSKELAGLLTVIIPRHPNRAIEIASELSALGLKVTRRSLKEPISPETDIYLVDTMGELGLFYRLTDIVFLGGTWASVGGHNPIEPAMLECAMIWGPYTHKQIDLCEVLSPCAIKVVTKDDFSNAVLLLLTDQDIRDQKRAGVQNILKEHNGVLDFVMDVLREGLTERRDGGSDETRTRDLRRDRPAL